MDLKLHNQTALVTGASTGIGLAIANLLAAEGANVVINSNDATELHAAIDQSPHRAKLTALVADLATADGVQQLTEQLPTVDLLINNLGIYQAQPFTQMTDQDWQLFMDINVNSGMRLARFYLPLMLEQNHGRIIFIASESGVNIPEEMIHYGVSKAAQIALANGLAKLTKGSRVTVNSILAGPTLTSGVKKFIHGLAEEWQIPDEAVAAEYFSKVRPGSLLNRFAMPEEVASIVVYLCSPLAGATNGAAIRVDGGTIQHV